MRQKNQAHKKENIVLIVGITLLAICWIGTEIRYQKYEAYAKKHNCEWQIINEKEICK